MGIYTSMASTGYTGPVAELALDEYANFEDVSLQMVAESEQNFSNIMKAIGLDELRYFEENGQEIVYEASGASAVFDKVKAFFKKLVEKVRQVVHAFIAKIQSWVQGDAQFVKKYQSEFSKNWASVKGDFGFKGYKFTIKPGYDKTAIDESSIKTVVKGYGDIEIDNKDVTALNNAVDDFRDNSEDKENATRAAVAKKYSDATATTATTEDSLTSSEFSEALFKAYRNGETSKVSIEKKDLSVNEIVATISGRDKVIDKAKSAEAAITKAINGVIKTFTDAEKVNLKDQTTKDTDKAKSDLLSAQLAYATAYAEQAKKASQYFVQANGIYLQALADNCRQCKAIMAKVVAGGKKLTESTSYSEGSSTGSFLESVVLK